MDNKTVASMGLNFIMAGIGMIVVTIVLMFIQVLF